MMPLETVVACPVCGNEKFEKFLSPQDHTVTNETFQLVRCSTCKLVITSPRPTREEIGKYYKSEKYISHTGGTANLVDSLYRVSRNIMLTWKRKQIEKFHQKGRLLDYGCGTGDFLQFMKGNGWNVSGVEPAEIARTKAIAKNVDVYSSLGELKNQKFDVITLWHVAEHLHELSETIHQLTQMLNPSGYLFIAVPNYQSLDATIYQSHWAGYDVPRHLWHFTTQSMKHLFEKNHITWIDTKSMFLDSSYISFLSESYRYPNQSKLINLLRGILTGMRSNLSAWKSNNYSSLLYIGRV